MVPRFADLRKEKLREFHGSYFAVYPGGTKMYHDLHRQYYWSGIKKQSWGFCSSVSHVSAGKS